MEKRKKGLLMAAVLLVAVIAVYGAVIHFSKESETETEAEASSMVISSVDSDAIVAIDYENNGKQMSFVKEDGQWLYEADRDFPVLQDSLTAMTNELAAVTAVRKLEDPEDLSEYGLDTPVWTIHYTDSDGRTSTIMVGSTNDSVDGCYLQLEDDTAVYMVDAAFTESFITDLYELADMEDFPTIETASMTGLTIQAGEKTLQLATAASADSGWIAFDGGEQKEACSASAVSALLNTVAGITFSQDIDYNCSDLSLYGLDTPVAAITVDYTEEIVVETESTAESAADESETEETETETVTVEKKAVLYIGGTDGDGDYYVCLDGSKEVHTMAKTTAENLMNYQLIDLMETSILSGSLDEVDRMTITIGDQSWQIEKKTETVTVEKDSEAEAEEESEEAETEVVENWYADGREIELLDLSSVYSQLSGMTAEQILETAVEPEGETTLTVALKLSDGTETGIDFTEYDTSFQLASVNGTARKLVNKRDVEKLILSLQELLQ